MLDDGRDSNFIHARNRLRVEHVQQPTSPNACSTHITVLN